MSMSEMQAVLGRLYVDDSFRQLFILRFESACRSYDLTHTETAALKQIDVDRVELFCSSLRRKRLEKLRRAYPALFFFDSGLVQKHVGRYCELKHVSANAPLNADALEFGLFMEETANASEDFPSFAYDVIRFERLCIWTRSSQHSARVPNSSTAPDVKIQLQIDRDVLALSPSTQIHRFDYDAPSLERLLRAGQPIEQCRTDMAILFKQADVLGDSKIANLSASTRGAFELCDGSRTMGDILAHFGTRSPTAQRQLSLLLTSSIASGVLVRV